jgi:RNA polymerase sigma-70 factor (ECF subfamily)
MGEAGMGAADEPDAALIAAAVGGDTESYGQLVSRYQGIAHRTAWLLGSGPDTEDVVQEAFVKAYLALHRFRIEEPFAPWLLTIVANETRNRWRWFARHRTVSLSLAYDEDPRVPGPTPEQVVEGWEVTDTLRDAVERLPAKQREVVTCRYLLELSERETAQVLHVPAGTVKSRLSRALRTLEDALTPSDEPDASRREIADA